MCWQLMALVCDCSEYNCAESDKLWGCPSVSGNKRTSVIIGYYHINYHLLHTSQLHYNLSQCSPCKEQWGSWCLTLLFTEQKCSIIVTAFVECPCAWSTSRAIHPTPGRRAELIWHCICPMLLINTETAHTNICGNWILQALLPQILQSLLKGERNRSLETSVSRDREKIPPLMHGCHSKTNLASCKGCEKVKVWT